MPCHLVHTPLTRLSTWWFVVGKFMLHASQFRCGRIRWSNRPSEQLHTGRLSCDCSMHCQPNGLMGGGEIWGWWRWAILDFSPPVRWGLLDFMSAFSSSSSSSSSSSFFSSFVVVLSALKRQPPQPSFLVVVLSALYREPPCPVFPAGPDHLRSVFPAGPQPQPPGPALSVPCRTSTATICAQCSLPDLSRDHLRSVFPAGPQPRPSALSVPCRTSTAR